MEGFPNWADTGCGCLAVLFLAIVLIIGALLSGNVAIPLG